MVFRIAPLSAVATYHQKRKPVAHEECHTLKKSGSPRGDPAADADTD